LADLAEVAYFPAMSQSAGEIAYHAGTAGTVTLAVGEKIIAIRALGASNATLTIFGGDSIPIPASYVFEEFVQSSHPEFVAATGKTDLVFVSTLSYFIKTRKAFT
jgi:hypothetical protein